MEWQLIFLIPQREDGATNSVSFSFVAARSQAYTSTLKFGIFQAYYETHQLSSATPSTISWIGSIQVWLVLVLGSISGPLFDAGYLRSLVASGTTLYVISFMLTSISTEYYHFLLSQGFGVGIGMGTMFSPALSCMGQHFARSKYRTIAFGIFSVGNSLGGLFWSRCRGERC